MLLEWDHVEIGYGKDSYRWLDLEYCDAEDYEQIFELDTPFEDEFEIHKKKFKCIKDEKL